MLLALGWRSSVSFCPYRRCLWLVCLDRINERIRACSPPPPKGSLGFYPCSVCQTTPHTDMFSAPIHSSARHHKGQARTSKLFKQITTFGGRPLFFFGPETGEFFNGNLLGVPLGTPFGHPLLFFLIIGESILFSISRNESFVGLLWLSWDLTGDISSQFWSNSREWKIAFSEEKKLLKNYIMI